MFLVLSLFEVTFVLRMCGHYVMLNALPCIPTRCCSHVYLVWFVTTRFEFAEFKDLLNLELAIQRLVFFQLKHVYADHLCRDALTWSSNLILL